MGIYNVNLNANMEAFVSGALEFYLEANPSASVSFEQAVNVICRRAINQASQSWAEIQAPPSEKEIQAGKQSVLRRHFQF